MFEQAFKNIDDVLRKEAGCTTELDYAEQTSWLLFLKYLDGLEEDKATEAALNSKKYNYILDKPFRWETWAAPKGKDGELDHNKALNRRWPYRSPFRTYIMHSISTCKIWVKHFVHKS
ncbi:MAG: type restriction enzyme protein [Gammaproteobacteria bacterium]|jgi:type I restriction enzyme M protein|nr:type restriction enzyme protein [Gammaproteobacteria bacterium]